MCLLNLTSLRHHFLFRVWYTCDKRERFPFFIFASVTSYSNPWFCSESFDFEENRNGTFNFYTQIGHFLCNFALFEVSPIFKIFSSFYYRLLLFVLFRFLSSYFYIDQIQDGSRVLSWGDLLEIRREDSPCRVGSPSARATHH